MQKELIIYVFIICNVIKIQNINFKVKTINSNAKRIKNVVKTSMLFIKLKKYKNIEKLLLHKNHDHVINITAKSSYDLLYNLLNIELTILKQYLNDVLTKE